MPPKRGHDAKIHRPLSLGTPIERGDDVEALQGQINELYDHFKIDRQIGKDGDLGGQTFDAANEIANCLGVIGQAQQKLRRGTISEGTQALIRGRKRTPEEEVAGRKREDFRQELRRRYSKSVGEAAVAKGRQLIGVKEQPEGSNWGGKVEEFIRFTGYVEAVYWCGCFACWVVVKLGGAKIVAMAPRADARMTVSSDHPKRKAGSGPKPSRI